MNKATKFIRQISIVFAGVSLIVGTYVSDGQLLSVLNSWSKRTLGQIYNGSQSLQSNMGIEVISSITGDLDAPKATIFAAGDIATCNTNQLLGLFGENLLYSIGIDISLPPSRSSQVRIADLIEKQPKSIFLGLGDFVYPNGSPARFNLCYDGVWGSIKGRTFPTPGNHDYSFFDAYAYFDYWGQQAGPDQKGYYSFQLNGWLIVSLNSEISAGPKSAQNLWLRRQLSASSARCILAFFHRPAYSSHERPGAEDSRHLFKVLHEHGASVVLTGHNHFYERNMPLDGKGGVDKDAGVISFTSGAVAQAWDYGQTKAAFTEELIADATGVLKLELGRTEFFWHYLIDSSGEIRDRGHADCNAKRAG